MNQAKKVRINTALAPGSTVIDGTGVQYRLYTREIPQSSPIPVALVVFASLFSVGLTLLIFGAYQASEKEKSLTATINEPALVAASADVAAAVDAIRLFKDKQPASESKPTAEPVSKKDKLAANNDSEERWYEEGKSVVWERTFVRHNGDFIETGMDPRDDDEWSVAIAGIGRVFRQDRLRRGVDIFGNIIKLTNNEKYQGWDVPQLRLRAVGQYPLKVTVKIFM